MISDTVLLFTRFNDMKEKIYVILNNSGNDISFTLTDRHVQSGIYEDLVSGRTFGVTETTNFKLNRYQIILLK